MTNKTKILFSEEELRVVTDTSWILTKQAITTKIYETFNEQVPVINQQLTQYKEVLPAVLEYAIPKISRGENYKGLPYVILDYPSVFEKDEIFAVRTMLWWGNFVSVTLLLSGGYKNAYGAAVSRGCVRKPEGLFICVHDNPWEHHFNESNYISMKELDEQRLKAIFAQRDFLKVSIKIDLAAFNQNNSLLQAGYSQILGLFGKA